MAEEKQEEMKSIDLVSIQELVEQFHRLDEAVFGQTEPLREFLQQNPVDAESLVPYLTWDRQHYTAI